MKIKARVYNTETLKSVFTLKMRETQKQASGKIRVKYSAPYAVYVHEAVGMVLKGLPRPSGIGNYWDPNGQAKYLEQPTRMYAKDMGAFICQQMRAGSTLLKAMTEAARILLRESKKLVPVEYGDLKASGHIEVER